MNIMELAKKAHEALDEAVSAESSSCKGSYGYAGTEGYAIESLRTAHAAINELAKAAEEAQRDAEENYKR